MITRKLLIAAVTLSVATPVAAETSGACPTASSSPQPAKRKFGLDGLISTAKNAGLFGSVAGSMRGDGNLMADVGGAAKAAAGRAATSGLDCVTTSGAIGEAESDQPLRPKAAPGLSYPSEIARPAGFEAAKRSYDEFGKVDCDDCEGGFAYDGWAVFPRDEFSGKYNAEAQRLGSLPVGHVHRWKGNESTGTLTVVAEQTVSGFRCRTLLYRLEKANSSAERPGLLCWGRANQFAGKESWNEVY